MKKWEKSWLEASILKKNINFAPDNIIWCDEAVSQEDVTGKKPQQILADLMPKIKEIYKERAAAFAEQGFDFSEVERMLLLQLLDQSWKQNLYELDQLQKSVSLRGYAQKDPLIEYQKESYVLYENMMTRIRDFFVDYIFRIKLPPKARAPQKMQEGAATSSAAPKQNEQKAINKIGRNDLCPCGSGKKYKKCCGK